MDFYGTWCPACIDLMPVLVDLYARYRGQGLEILSIAFEPLDDPKLVAKQVERLKKSYGIAWKSSIRDVDQRSTILKDLENAEGFPITLFVDRNGMVRGMHSGFVSAAIGDDHKKLLEKFETLTKQILETGDGE
ncbi:MAG: TlpA family protein disulfide reductase [Myxococcales bacterium]|nr:TlpA family protein disulfide reductase [Myxococcales bacterium]